MEKEDDLNVDEFKDILDNVGFIVDYVMTQARESYTKVGLIIGDYENETGKNPQDPMSFDDFFILTERMSTRMMMVMAVSLKKAIQLALTDARLGSPDE